MKVDESSFFDRFKRMYWKMSELLSGKKSVDLAKKSISAYANGDLEEGMKLGVESNKQFVAHLRDEVKSAAKGIWR